MLAASLVSLALGAAPTGTLIVLNKAEATASLIDVASGMTVASLPTGQGPHEAATSPDGRLVLASNYGTAEAPGSSLTLLDVPGARVVKTIDLGEYRRPHGLRWLNARTAVVTCEGSKALAIVDVAAGRVVASVPTEREVSHMVAVAPGGARAYVASIGSGSLTAIDIVARKVLAQIETGKGAEGVDVTPDGREVWVANREADSVSVIDAASLQVVASLESASFPIRVRFTPSGRSALVSHARSGDLSVIDVASRRELRRIPMALEALPLEGRLFQQFGKSPAPIGIEIPPDGQVAYVANANADLVAVLSLESQSLTGLIRAGKEPDGMAFSPFAAGTPKP